MSLINKILILIVFVVICGAFIGGCQYGKSRVKCHIITHDTTYVHDTVTHVIVDSFPYYIQGKDSIIYQPVPQNVDTAYILKNFYAKHIYPRKWENDTLRVLVSDTISQNRSIGNLFTYKIKTPFVTTINNVDNSVTYNRYFAIGGDMPINDPGYLTLDAEYIWDKGSVSIGYMPKLKSFTVGAKGVLFKFKKKK